jgi:hypothetical protein
MAPDFMPRRRHGYDLCGVTRGITGTRAVIREMSRFFFAAFALVTVASTSIASADSPSVIATWSRVGADGTTLANSLSVSGSELIARISSSDGSVTTDSGPLADIDTLGATICAHPEVMMITIGLKSKSFHENGDDPRDPANFDEDMFFLDFGDVQSEKQVASALSVLTGVAVQYDTDCTSQD